MATSLSTDPSRVIAKADLLLNHLAKLTQACLNVYSDLPPSVKVELGNAVVLIMSLYEPVANPEKEE